eukprot:6490663-Amphidinium_carterae.2
MSSHLAPKTGHQAEDELSPVAQMYMTNVVLPNRPPGLNLRNEREMRTLALILDHIIRGQLLQAADVAMQRFKAVEMASGPNATWEFAQRLELIPQTAIATTSFLEREAAMKAELRERKLTRMNLTWSKGNQPSEKGMKGKGKGKASSGWNPQ